MKKNLSITVLIAFICTSLIAQISNNDDYVNLYQLNQKYPGFISYTYRGLHPVGHAQFKMFNYGGTPEAKTALGANETLGSYVFNGYDGSQNVISAVIQARTITNSRDPRINFLLSNGTGNQRPNRMTIIGQSGYVGIGTTSPTEKLDINGNIRMRTGAMAGYIPVSDADGKMTWTDPSTLFTSSPWIEGDFGSIHKISGHVGIGTDSPSAPLEVVAQTGQNAIFSTESLFNYAGFRNNSGTLMGYLGIFNNVNDMDFGTGYGNTTGNVHLTIDADPKLTISNVGDVGVGTIIPTAQLHVEGDANSSQNLIYAKVNNSNANEITGIDIDVNQGDGIGYGGCIQGGKRGLTVKAQGGGSLGVIRAFVSTSYGTGGSSGARLGVSGYAENEGGNQGYGVWGESSDAITNYGVYGTGYGGTTNYAAYFVGNLTLTGTFSNPSDQKLKRNISNYKNALEAIRLLEVKKYEYKTDEYEYMNLSGKKQVGFIAQELEKILPHLVSEEIHPIVIKNVEEDEENVTIEKMDYKSINHLGLIPILTQGIKELSTENEKIKAENLELKDEMAELKNIVGELKQQFSNMENNMQNCCLDSNSPSNKEETITNVELNGNTEQAILEQNAPNPFNAQTEIRYYIPSSATKGQMMITDSRGAVLKTINLSETGFGTVFVRAGELAPDTYAYTLFVDGNKVATKQMILVK